MGRRKCRLRRGRGRFLTLRGVGDAAPTGEGSWGSDLQISGGGAGVLAHGLFGGRVILPVDSAQYLPVARQNTAFQGQTRAVVQRLHLFQQGMLLHLAQDICDDHGHLIARGAGQQAVETDVQLSKAAVIAQGLLRRRETAVQRRQILVGAAPGRPAGDGAVVDGAVLAQLQIGRASWRERV